MKDKFSCLRDDDKSKQETSWNLTDLNQEKAREHHEFTARNTP